MIGRPRDPELRALDSRLRGDLDFSARLADAVAVIAGGGLTLSGPHYLPLLRAVGAIGDTLRISSVARGRTRTGTEFSALLTLPHANSVSIRASGASLGALLEHLPGAALSSPYSPWPLPPIDPALLRPLMAGGLRALPLAVREIGAAACRHRPCLDCLIAANEPDGTPFVVAGPAIDVADPTEILRARLGGAAAPERCGGGHDDCLRGAWRALLSQLPPGWSPSRLAGYEDGSYEAAVSGPDGVVVARARARSAADAVRQTAAALAAA